MLLDVIVSFPNTIVNLEPEKDVDALIKQYPNHKRKLSDPHNITFTPLMTDKSNKIMNKLTPVTHNIRKLKYPITTETLTTDLVNSLGPRDSKNPI